MREWTVERDVASAIVHLLEKNWVRRDGYEPRYEVVANTSTGFIVRDADRAPYSTFEVSVREL